MESLTWKVTKWEFQASSLQVSESNISLYSQGRTQASRSSKSPYSTAVQVYLSLKGAPGRSTALSSYVDSSLIVLQVGNSKGFSLSPG